MNTTSISDAALYVKGGVPSRPVQGKKSTKKSRKSEKSGIKNPRMSNRGVVNTDSEVLTTKTPFVSGVSIDWVEFTLFARPAARRNMYGGEIGEDGLPVSLTIEEREDIESGKVDPAEYLPEPWDVLTALWLLDIDAENMRILPRGMHGYKKQAIAKGVRVLWDGAPEMGLHVIISGDALKALSIKPETVITRMVEAQGKPTRIDIAIDDFDGGLDLGQMIDYCRKGQCSSRLKEWRTVESGLIKDGSLTGQTLYVGSRESDFMCRFYDKRLEQLKSGADPEKLPDHWIRAEAECKGDAAINVALELVARGDLATMGREIINNYVGFKDRCKKGKPTEDTNKARWDKAPWWCEWIDTIERLSISRRVHPSDLEKRKKWFARQCLTSMAILLETFGTDVFVDLYKTGKAHITKEQRAEINKYKEDRKNRRFSADFLTESQPNLAGQVS